MAIFFKYIQNIRREPQTFGVDLKEHETIPKFKYLQILFSFFSKMEIKANRLISDDYIWDASACNFNTRNTPLEVFSTFFKSYKWYQIAQRIIYMYKQD